MWKGIHMGRKYIQGYDEQNGGWYALSRGEDLSIDIVKHRVRRSAVVMSRQSLHQRNFLLSRQEEERSVDGRTGVLRFLRLTFLLHAHKRHRDLLEQALDVVSCLRRCLHEHDVELCSLRVCLLQRHLSVQARDM